MIDTRTINKMKISKKFSVFKKTRGFLKQIKKECRPLIELKPFIKAIWIYGSVIKRPKKTSDIDMLVLVDDTKEGLKIEFLKKVEGMIEGITEKAKKSGLKLHFQPPKLLSHFWELIRHGEPWAITALRELEIIYDDSEYIALLHRLLKKGQLYSSIEKSERLLERAKEKIGENKAIFLEKMPYEILMSMTESAQTVLMYYEKVPPSPKDVVAELKKVFLSKKLIDEQLVNDYDESYELVRKIRRGRLTEFSGKDFDRYFAKAKCFIFAMEDLLIKLEQERKEKAMLKAYEDSLKLCEKALKKKIRKLPQTDKERIEQFKKYFIDTGLVDTSHYITLRELYDYKESKEKRKELEKDKYLDNIHIKSLELAVKDLAR